MRFWRMAVIFTVLIAIVMGCDPGVGAPAADCDPL